MATLIRTVAVVTSVLVLLGFAGFVSDQASHASKTQVRAIGDEPDDPAPDAAAERARERSHGKLREAIDDANDVLLSPFAGITTSRNDWVRRAVPTLLALLAYGLLLGLIANMLPRSTRGTRDWRAV
jgi:hypothetical protein